MKHLSGHDKRPSFLYRLAPICLTGALLGVCSATAQTPPPCTTPECAAASHAWATAAAIHQIKNELIAAVRQLAEAAAGTYGDEGPRITAGIETMRATVDRWDEAIRAFEASLAAVDRSTDVHLALGSAYLDRSRADDALREFAGAGQRDARRVEVHTSSALASDLLNKPADAARAFLGALSLEPGNPILQYNLAQRLFKAGQRESAVDALRRFGKSGQQALRAQLRLGDAPFERAGFLRQAAGVAPIFPTSLYARGFALLTSGQYEQAVEQLQDAASQDPLVAQSRADVRQAAADLRQGRLRPALTRLTSALAASPNDSETHRLLGIAYSADDQFEKSIEHLSTAIRLNARDERSRLALADALTAAGRPADAERALTETLQANPASGAAHERLGLLYQSQSLHRQAVTEFERAAALAPLVGQDRLYEVIGSLYANQADFDATVAAYLKRIDVNPNNADAHRKLGDIYYLQGQSEEALAEFTAALLLDARNADAEAGIAQTHLRLGEYADAVSAASRALALSPEHRQARYTRATALIRLGMAEEGARELAVFQRLEAETSDKARRKSELDAITLEAARSASSGDHDAAIALLRQAIAVEPGLGASYVALGDALLKAGRHAEAIEQFEQALQRGDGADVHRYLADAHKALGHSDESAAQSSLYIRMVEAGKEERLRKLAGTTK